tara:strand:+ start:1323 stop:1613 length:291 start_codon:yes stop_codon:yes gene_type:complete
MRIVNPAFGMQNEAARDERAAGAAPVDWLNDPIAIISNSKPNAQELLEGLRRQMGAFRKTDNIDYLFKDSAAQPAPPALIDTVTKNYRAAILALAD